jgi:hypothetical protein
MAWQSPGDDFELQRLEAPEVRVFRDDHRRLFLSLGKHALHENVAVARAFPLTAADSSVFFLDAEGRQIGYIESLDSLDADSRSVLDEELDLKYFTARVRAILGVTSSHGITTWDLETDRGRRVVHLRDRSDIRRLPPRRAVMTDAHGMRYEIPDTGALDERSLGFFEAES